VVTAASRGIGRGIAEHLAALGADVALVQRSDAADAAAAVRAAGVRAEVIQADLSSPQAAEAAVVEAADRLGRLDVLVCNAGVIHREPALDVSLADFERVVAMNLTATFAAARAAARRLVAAQQSGSIVLIGSLLSFQGGVNVAAYAATKAGVANLARALANEWAPHGIRVNAVAPGYIATDQTAPLLTDAARKAELDARIPAGRWGTPADVAHAVGALLVPGMEYVTGHTLVVDGGWMAR